MKRILLSLALAGSSCSMLKSMNDISHYFASAEKLMVNTNPAIHYYVQASREQGIQELRQLAVDSLVEESFFHLQAGGVSYWFECGEQETVASVHTSSGCIEPVLQELTTQQVEITQYHIHPSKTIETAIAQDQSDLDKDLLKYYSSALFSRSSAQDVVAHSLFKKFWNSFQEVHYGKSYVVVATGIFSIDTNPRLDQEIMATYSRQGPAAAVEQVHHAIEQIHLEDIFAILEGTLERLSMERGKEIIIPNSLTPTQLLQRRLQESARIGIYLEYHPF